MRFCISITFEGFILLRFSYLYYSPRLHFIVVQLSFLHILASSDYGLVSLLHIKPIVIWFLYYTFRLYIYICLCNFKELREVLSASDIFCRLLITFANRLYPDQARQNVMPGLD